MPYYSIFQQLFKFIPRYRFDKKAEATSGNRYCKHFSAWRQFLTCLYAQITGKDSLREIASGLMTNQSRLYHLGMKAVAKSTLADAYTDRSRRKVCRGKIKRTVWNSRVVQNVLAVSIIISGLIGIDNRVLIQHIGCIVMD